MLPVDLFLDAHAKAPRQVTLDLDATDNPLHATRKAGFSTPTTTATATCRSVFCGRNLPAAKLGRSNIDAATGTV